MARKQKKELTQLARNIRAMRTYSGETQEELAKILHCKQNAISQYENDSKDNKKRHIPTADTLKALSQHFDITVYQLENAVLNLVALGGKGEEKRGYTEADLDKSKVHFERY